jgi:hypothetical protein
MTKKQEIYLELMRLCIPYVRNRLSYGIIYGKKRKELFEITNLIHDLYVSILDKEFTDHDVWIINVHMKNYCEKNEETFLYPEIAKLVNKLIESLPVNKKCKIEWK